MAETLSPQDFHMGQVRYHRAMAVAYADNPEQCAHHTQEMTDHLNALRKLALDAVEGKQ